MLKKNILLIILLLFANFLFSCGNKVVFKNDGTGDYYKKEDGTYATNEWIQKGKDWYYFDGNGYLLKNSVTPDLYYVEEDGKMAKNKWVNIAGSYLYADDNGAFKQNEWIEDNGKQYYVGADGIMVTNACIDNYWINEKGEKTQDISLYNNIINSINKNTKSGTGYQPTSIYVGYQFYDGDNDGQVELYVLRQLQYLDSYRISLNLGNDLWTAYYSKPHIEYTYKIKNNTIAQTYQCGLTECPFRIEEEKTNNPDILQIAPVSSSEPCEMASNKYGVICIKNASGWNGVSQSVEWNNENIFYDSNNDESMFGNDNGWRYNGSPIDGNKLNSICTDIYNTLGYFNTTLYK